MTPIRWLATVALLSSILNSALANHGGAATVAPSDWLFSGIDTAHPTSNQLTLSAGERPAIALLRIVDADGHAHLFAPHAVAARHRLSLTLPVLASLHLTPPLSLEVRALAPLGAVLRQQASGHSWLVSSTAVHIASAGAIYLAAQSVAGSPPRLALLSSAPISTRVVLTARGGGRAATIAFHLPAYNARWVPISLFPGVRGALLVSVSAQSGVTSRVVTVDTCACRTQSSTAAIDLLTPLRPHREPRISAATPTSTSPLQATPIPPAPTNTSQPQATPIPPAPTSTSQPQTTPIPPAPTSTSQPQTTPIPPAPTNTSQPQTTPIPPAPTNTSQPQATPIPPTPSPTLSPTSGIPSPPSPPSPP